MKKEITKLVFLRICSIIGMFSFLSIVNLNSQCPDLTLNVITDSSVCDNENDTVIIENSGSSVIYQVFESDFPVSAICDGTGNNLSIPVHSSRLDTGFHTLHVKAFQNPIDNNQAFVFETQVPPVIDGIPDEEEWRLIRDYPMITWGDPPQEPEFFGQWGAMYDDSCLYLAVYVQDISLPSAPIKDTTQLHRNDAVEFVIQRGDTMIADGIKMIVDCDGQASQQVVTYDGYHYPPLYDHVVNKNSNNAWSAEIRFKWEDLGYTSPPDTMKFDTYLDFAEPSTPSVGQRIWFNYESFFDISKAGTVKLVPADTCPVELMDSVHVQIIDQLDLIIHDPPAAIYVDITDTAITMGSTGLTGNQLTYWNDSTCIDPLHNPDSITVAGTYYIKLSSQSCFDIAPVNVTISTTGVCDELFPEYNYALYPNPLSYGEMTFQPVLFEPGESIIISVFNDLGQQILSKQLTISGKKMSVPLLSRNNIQPGLYFVKVTGQQKQEFYKLIVE